MGDQKRPTRPTPGSPCISASVLAADPAALGAEVARAESAGVDRFHVDVMDGLYVPNLALTPHHVAALRRHTSLPIDLHLEVQHPDRILETIPCQGAATIIVQLDTLQEPSLTFRQIRSAGATVGLALNPTEDLSRVRPWLPDLDMLVVMAVEPGFAGQNLRPGAFEKLTLAARMRAEAGLNFAIALDGGVTTGNAAQLVAAGADTLIAGTALFRAADMRSTVKALKASPAPAASDRTSGGVTMPSARGPARVHTPTDREQLLCDVASLYYEQNLTQEKIARRVGVTRSMISRLLTEARRRGLVEIHVKRTGARDASLEAALAERFGLKAVAVAASTPASGLDRGRSRLGLVGAQVLLDYLQPKSLLGVGWGTSVNSLVQEIQAPRPLAVKVVQLVGALGGRNLEYDGQTVVQRAAEKLGGEGYFLHAPFLVEDRKTALQLLANPAVRETVAMLKQCDLALTGVGSTDPRFSSYYHAGYVPMEELERLRTAGAVGDVCGHHLDARGKEVAGEFDARLVSISRSDFLGVPTRIGIAAGPGKALALLAALRGSYLNVLLTDRATASQILTLDSKPD